MPETYQSKFNDLCDVLVTRLQSLADADSNPVFKRVEKRWTEFGIVNFPVALVTPQGSAPLKNESTNVDETRELTALVAVVNREGDEAANVQAQLWLVSKVEEVCRGQREWIAGHFDTRIGLITLLPSRVEKTNTQVAYILINFHVDERWK